MIEYSPESDQDLLLAQWWALLKATGDIDKLFYEPPSLGRFLGYFRSPAVLLLELDDTPSIWFAAWFEPVFSSSFFSVWVREDHRGTKGEREAFGRAALAGFARFGDPLIGVTKQEDLLPLHEHLGYTIVGKLPALWSGSDLWIMLLHSETLFVDQRKREAKDGRRRRVQ